MTLGIGEGGEREREREREREAAGERSIPVRGYKMTPISKRRPTGRPWKPVSDFRCGRTYSAVVHSGCMK
jgi:hypothetical protein